MDKKARPKKTGTKRALRSMATNSCAPTSSGKAPLTDKSSTLASRINSSTAPTRNRPRTFFCRTVIFL